MAAHLLCAHNIALREMEAVFTVWLQKQHRGPSNQFTTANFCLDLQVILVNDWLVSSCNNAITPGL